ADRCFEVRVGSPESEASLRGDRAREGAGVGELEVAVAGHRPRGALVPRVARQPDSGAVRAKEVDDANHDAAGHLKERRDRTDRGAAQDLQPVAVPVVRAGESRVDGDRASVRAQGADPVLDVLLTMHYGPRPGLADGEDAHHPSPPSAQPHSSRTSGSDMRVIAAWISASVASPRS